jgi:hypothetical protein
MFKDNAYKYIERGLVVIPLNGKIPVIKNWSAFAKSKPSDILIESWESRYAKHNIGLVTGKLSGIVAIDIDKDSAKSLVPLSPVVKKGKKGETRFFRYNGEINFKRHDLGIELLSDGNQTVIPPSIHPETKEPYVWTTPDTLENFDVEDLPILPEKFFKDVGSTAIIRGGESTGRHNKLIEICSAMLSRNEDLEAIVGELMRFDEETHVPPYFTDKTEPHKGKGRLAAMKMVTSVADTIVQRGGELEGPKKIEIIIGEEVIQREIDEAERSSPEMTLPRPKSYVLEMLTGYIVSQSYKRRPKFALASALALSGTLLSNKYKFGGSTPNLFQLLVADSGEGKDVPLKMPKTLLVDLGLLQYLGLETYRGDKSVVKKFEFQRERIDVIDEISKLFRAMGSQNNIYSANIAETLTEIWNSSTSLFTGFATATETTGMVYSPCLTLLGATTPSAFSDTFSKALLSQGFGARFLYIFEDKRVELTPPTDITLPKDVEQWLTRMGSKTPDTIRTDISKMGSISIDLSGSKPTSQVLKEVLRPNPVELPISREVAARRLELMKYYDELAYHVPEVVRPVALRAYQQVEKLMIIHAVTRQDTSNPAPLIETVDMDFGHAYVEGCLTMTKRFLDSNLILSKFHRESGAIIAFLKKHKGGVTQKELTLAMVNRFKASELYDRKTGIVASLVDAGKILEFKVEGKTKPTTKFAYNWNSEG